MITTVVTCLCAGETKIVCLLVCWNESQASLSVVGIQDRHTIPGMYFLSIGTEQNADTLSTPYSAQCLCSGYFNVVKEQSKSH